jgi:D-alanyl-D-alanine dipeptidase
VPSPDLPPENPADTVLRERLGAAWRAFRAPGRELPAGDTLRALEGRVAALEDIQTRRELEWAETKSALDRMLKRFAALDQRARAREDETNGAAPRNRDQLRELMRQKGYLKGE